MADDAAPRQLSLVPYTSTDREIVLQQGGAVVIYDNRSKLLSVRRDTDLLKDDTECPYCHRPYHEAFPNPDSGTFGESTRPTADRSFVDPEYFRMLAQSQRPSPADSGAHTPLGRIPQYIPRALRSGRSRDVSGSQPPPTTEFAASDSDPAESQGISSSAFSPGYFKQLFREERELGRGGNGVVLLVEHVLDGFSLGQFACKRIPVGNDHRWLEKVLVEVKLLTQVSHTNLVKYHWVWVEEYQPSTFGPRIPCVWILQQYCNAGDLHRYVIGPKNDNDSAESQKARYRRRSKGKLTPADTLHRQSRLTLEEIFSFFKDITSGLHHLHSKGYIHRDVKPSNCLLLTDQGRTRVLLSDFGEVQAAGTRRGNTGATGTISYCAPEVLQMHSDGQFGNFTTKSDIFSLGMIVYFMCFGHLPYANASDEDDYDEKEDLELLRAEITGWQGFEDVRRSRQDLPDRLYRYLQLLLSVDPNQRPSTEDILSSIKTSSNLAETLSAKDASTTSRVTPLDTTSKSRQASSARPKESKYDMPPMNRKLSMSTYKSSQSPASRANEPTEHMRASSASSQASSRPHSPRLIMPPPPKSATDRLLSKIRDPSPTVLLRSAILLVKIVSLTATCTPAAPEPIVFYPLVLVALLELVFVELQASTAIASLALHMLVVVLLRDRACCEQPMVFMRESALR